MAACRSAHFIGYIFNSSYDTGIVYCGLAQILGVFIKANQYLFGYRVDTIHNTDLL